MIRAGYSHTIDLITSTPVYDAAAERYGLIPHNFGKNQNINAMVNYRRQIFKIWTANMTVQSAYQINTSNEALAEFEGKGTSLMAQFSNNIAITPTLSADVTGMYISGMRSGYMVMEPFGNFSAGLRQMLLKNKMTVSLNINDILYTNKTKISSIYDNVNYSFYNEWDSRNVNLALRYNFGSAAVRAARSKTTGIEEEASRAR
jgi:hypothetical protein